MPSFRKAFLFHAFLSYFKYNNRHFRISKRLANFLKCHIYRFLFLNLLKKKSFKQLTIKIKKNKLWQK